jgi:hypothetical protein
MSEQAATETLMANFRTLFGEAEKTTRETLQPPQDHGV